MMEATVTVVEESKGIVEVQNNKVKDIRSTFSDLIKQLEEFIQQQCKANEALEHLVQQRQKLVSSITDIAAVSQQSDASMQEHSLSYKYNERK